jgi:hypothetical protein
MNPGGVIPGFAAQGSSNARGGACPNVRGACPKKCDDHLSTVAMEGTRTGSAITIGKSQTQDSKTYSTACKTSEGLETNLVSAHAGRNFHHSYRLTRRVFHPP